MSERASESIVAHKIAPGDYRYTITLKDTGTTPIGTFWFAWVPGEDFLPSKPEGFGPEGLVRSRPRRTDADRRLFHSVGREFVRP